jgi:hypothetical protein
VRASFGARVEAFFVPRVVVARIEIHTAAFLPPGRYNVGVRIAPGRVVSGRVELDAELPWGAAVTALAQVVSLNRKARSAICGELERVALVRSRRTLSLCPRRSASAATGSFSIASRTASRRTFT